MAQNAELFKATPTIVVGIGGTGLKVATFVKKSLMEANHNRLPDRMGLMVLDTEEQIKFETGGWGKARGLHHATGPVRIDAAGEYLPLTGNVKVDLGIPIKQEQIAGEGNPYQRETQPHWHLNGWFQAQYYIDTVVVDDQNWNLSVGAGKYRQFGRIAGFKNIDRLTGFLQNLLSAIHAQGAAGVIMHVAESLVGGTGSALFLDEPHLVRTKSDEVQRKVTEPAYGRAYSALAAADISVCRPFNLGRFAFAVKLGIVEERQQLDIVRRQPYRHHIAIVASFSNFYRSELRRCA